MEPAPLLELTDVDREAVAAALRRPDLAPRHRERLEMVKAAGLGFDLPAICAWSGRDPRTVRRWLAAFAAGGVAALADAPRAGRPPKAGAAYLAALEQAVATTPRSAGRSTSGPRPAWPPTWKRRPAPPSPPAGCGCCCTGRTSPAAGPSTPWTTCRTRRRSPPAPRRCGRRGEKVRAEPDRYELHFEDETHLETNPHLSRVWHRVGGQPTLPAAGTNRRLTVFGSVTADGAARIELVTAAQDSAAFARYLALLEARHDATGRNVLLALDNGPAHASKASKQALAERTDWLEVIWLAKYAPELNPKEREWKVLKRDHRAHLAADLRSFVDEALAGLRGLGGAEQTVVDEVPDWWLVGKRKPPTGRPPGRPKGAKDSRPRKPRSRNIAAPT